MKQKLIALGTSGGAVGALMAAVFSTLCCAGPAVLAVIGAGGAAAAAGLAPYGPYFLTGSLAILGIGFWSVYRPVITKIDGVCPVRIGKPMRLVLWSALVIWIAAAGMFAATKLSSAFEPKGPISEHVALGAHAETLRMAFNADAEKVRVVMLVAPT